MLLLFVLRRIQQHLARIRSSNPRIKVVRVNEANNMDRIQYIRFLDSRFSPSKPSPNLQITRTQKGPRTFRDRFNGWSPSVKFLVASGVLGGGYYISHLEQVPCTGRWRYRNAGENIEVVLGKLVRFSLYDEKPETILSPTHPTSQHVRDVVSRILTANHLGVVKTGQPKETVTEILKSLFSNSSGESSSAADFRNDNESDMIAGHRVEPLGGLHTLAPPTPEKEWEVLVVEDVETVNAMAAPGIIIVFTGILPVCKNEEGLAALLAHEIGHVVARHTAESISVKAVWYTAAILLQAFAGLDYLASRGFTKLFLELPISRVQEYEADHIGLCLMSKACYSPGEAPGFFDRLGRHSNEGRRVGMYSLLNTHPASELRVKVLQEALPKAQQILDESSACAGLLEEYESFWNKLKVDKRQMAATQSLQDSRKVDNDRLEYIDM